jgi:KDEL-tailed cysteine endopeptidase
VERYEKSYAGEAEEYARRFQVWVENLEYVVSYNAKQASHWLHINHMADLTQEEFKQSYLGYRHDLKQPRVSNAPYIYEKDDGDKLPPMVDWLAQGAVTEVGVADGDVLNVSCRPWG